MLFSFFLFFFVLIFCVILAETTEQAMQALHTLHSAIVLLHSPRRNGVQWVRRTHCAHSEADSLHPEESVQYTTNWLSYFSLIMCHITGTINVLIDCQFQAMIDMKLTWMCLNVVWFNPIDPNPAKSARAVLPQSGQIRREKRLFFQKIPHFSKIEP